ncbi:hypothetical protein [Umezawaea sp. NPDC059074]|uniref:hypothetical protein n=1 Tax=Umezawaea sp. NPDC059074 TaxID=3346716 RepID=UPI0036CBB419
MDAKPTPPHWPDVRLLIQGLRARVGAPRPHSGRASRRSPVEQNPPTHKVLACTDKTGGPLSGEGRAAGVEG